jgi:DNA-directed RNA polymerase subunit RPC12/RpoP
MPFENTKMELPCQGCGEKMPTSLADIEQNPVVTCPSCGAKTEVRGGAEPLAALRELSGSLSRLGARRVR